VTRGKICASWCGGALALAWLNGVVRDARHWACRSFFGIRAGCGITASAGYIGAASIMWAPSRDFCSCRTCSWRRRVATCYRSVCIWRGLSRLCGSLDHVAGAWVCMQRENAEQLLGGISRQTLCSSTRHHTFYLHHTLIKQRLLAVCASMLDEQTSPDGVGRQTI